MKIEREELKPGDHIYTWRKFNIYAHHGIYIGEGKVVHLRRRERNGSEGETGTILDIFSSNRRIGCEICREYQKEVNGVTLSCIECFLAGGKLYLFEYSASKFKVATSRIRTCTHAPSDPPETVLSRATSLLQNGFGEYNLFKNNCEDFALFCKTSNKINDGDRKKWSLLAAGAIGAGVLVAAASTMGVRSAANQVPHGRRRKTEGLNQSQ